MFWILLTSFGPILTIGFFFARRQDCINRSLDALDDTRQDAGYVGPHISGPS